MRQHSRTSKRFGSSPTGTRRGVDTFDRGLILSVFTPDATLDHTAFGFQAPTLPEPC